MRSRPSAFNSKLANKKEIYSEQSSNLNQLMMTHFRKISPVAARPDTFLQATKVTASLPTLQLSHEKSIPTVIRPKSIERDFELTDSSITESLKDLRL